MTDFIYVSGVGVLIAVVLLIIFGPPYYGYTLAYKPTRVNGKDVEPTVGAKIGGWTLMVGWPILLIVGLRYYMMRKNGSDSTLLITQ